MIRRLGVVVIAAVVAGVLAAAPVAAQDGEGSGAAASTVRIQARLLESGKVELGLQLDGDREWLPQARLFPYATATVGNWLFASPYTLSDATVVRIQARRVASGKVEFGLQLDGDEVWLPQARLFPYATATVGELAVRLALHRRHRCDAHGITGHSRSQRRDRDRRGVHAERQNRRRGSLGCRTLGCGFPSGME